MKYTFSYFIKWVENMFQFLGTGNFHTFHVSTFQNFIANKLCSWKLSKPQLNVNSTTIQPKLGLTWKWLCTPTTQTQCQLLLTRFWPNFKGRFLGPSWTDSNCSSDICPDNIRPSYICPYQEYFSCCWPDLEKI